MDVCCEIHNCYSIVKKLVSKLSIIQNNIYIYCKTGHLTLILTWMNLYHDYLTNNVFFLPIILSILPWQKWLGKNENKGTRNVPQLGPKLWVDLEKKFFKCRLKKTWFNLVLDLSYFFNVSCPNEGTMSPLSCIYGSWKGRGSIQKKYLCRTKKS